MHSKWKLSYKTISYISNSSKSYIVCSIAKVNRRIKEIRRNISFRIKEE
jgi:hypothetical protein